MECTSVAVQTEHVRTDGKPDEVLHSAISVEVFSMLLLAVKSNNMEPNILARLNIFHRTDFVTLSTMKQFQLPQVKSYSVSPRRGAVIHKKAFRVALSGTCRKGSNHLLDPEWLRWGQRVKLNYWNSCIC